MRKISLIIMLSVILLFIGCSRKDVESPKGISVPEISSSIGSVGQDTNDFENQSFKYNITLVNNGEDKITVVSVTPILTEPFASTVSDKNVTVKVNRAFSKGESIEVSGEIIFNTKGLDKEEILAMTPFVKAVKIKEERLVQSSF